MRPPVPTAKAVFDRAHEIADPAERAAYLDEVCPPSLRTHVEALLRALDEAGSFMQRPALASGTGRDEPSTGPHEVPTGPHEPAPGPREPANIRAGEWVGPYCLERVLGKGGMGEVWLARQEQPIRRKVAIKLIKSAGPDVDARARFAVECQALTVMDHPNIARIYEAGDQAGMPYLAMEYVEGEILTRFCDVQGMTVRERLELFADVCDAIQHAHQQGVIHRDLKPGNLLAAVKDGKRVVKVIDFGLAKATSPGLTGEGELTAFGSVLGTLDYMSPEQADSSGPPADTRADVYSLGATLYALLTGVPPFDPAGLRARGVLEALRKIKEDEPARPSLRVAAMPAVSLAEAAKSRGVTPSRLSGQLAGELDWIVARALEKDRARRYRTADAFARDVRRYLAGDPVEAGPPSVAYRLGKYARKYWLPLGVAAAFVLGLIVAVVTVDAARRRAVTAERGRHQALDISDAAFFLLTRNAKSHTPREKAVLRNLASRLETVRPVEGDDEGSRAMAAASHLKQGIITLKLDQPAKAEAHYREAITRYAALVAYFPDKPGYRDELARCQYDLGFLLAGQGKKDEAIAAYREAVRLGEGLAVDFPAEDAYRGNLADALNNLGTTLRDLKRWPEAEATLRRTCELGGGLVKAEPNVVEYRLTLGASSHNLGNVLRDQGKVKDSLEWYARALDALAPVPLPHPEAQETLRNAHWDRAHGLGRLEKHAEAKRDWQRAIQLNEDPAARPHLPAFLAAAEAEDALRKTSKPSPETLYAAAVVNARAAAAAKAVGDDGLQGWYEKRALERLSGARAAGWFLNAEHAKRLAAETAFQSLPGDDWKRLLEAVAADAKRKAGGG